MGSGKSWDLDDHGRIRDEKDREAATRAKTVNLGGLGCCLDPWPGTKREHVKSRSRTGHQSRASRRAGYAAGDHALVDRARQGAPPLAEDRRGLWTRPEAVPDFPDRTSRGTAERCGDPVPETARYPLLPGRKAHRKGAK